MGQLLAPPASIGLQRDPKYRELTEMTALAGMLSRLVADDLEDLARKHGADLGAARAALREADGAFELGRSIGFAEKAKEYLSRAVAANRRGRSTARAAVREVLAVDFLASVPSGLQHAVSRTRPTLLVGEPRAVRPLIDYVIGTAAGTTPEPAIFHLRCGPGGQAPGVDSAAWHDNLHSVKALTPGGTDLLVVDDVLHGVRAKQAGKVRSRFERGTLAVQRLNAFARNHRIAVVAGFYWDDTVDRDDVHYRAMKEWADSYRVERTATDLVVYDQAGSDVLTVPLRRGRRAAA